MRVSVTYNATVTWSELVDFFGREIHSRPLSRVPAWAYYAVIYRYEKAKKEFNHAPQSK